MSLLGTLAPASTVSIGNAAGWALAFFKEKPAPNPTGEIGEQVCRFSREGYNAEIDATLPHDLFPGLYQFTIEGLTDADHRLIQQDGLNRPTIVKLYLYWRDANATVTGYLASVGGITDLVSGGGLVGAAAGALGGAVPDPLASVLVAVLTIKRVTRQVGTRRYETLIEATERVHARLNNPLTGGLTAENREAAARRVAQLGAVPIQVYPAVAGATPGFSRPAGTLLREVLTDIASDYEAAGNKRGRGQLLIRDGKLYLGVRPIPLHGADIELDLAGGLIETKRIAQQPADPNHDANTDPPPPDRNQYQLTLKGRPDIKPGDVVKFEAPPETENGPITGSLGTALSGAIGGLGTGGALIASLTGTGPKTRAYVSSVRHRLGRRSSFSTVVTCLKIADSGDDGWDTHSPAGSRERTAGSGSQATSANPALDAARAVQRTASDVADRVYTAEVGEIRAVHPTGTSEPPGQTTKLWRGLAAPDGLDRQARRLPVRRDHPEALDGVPYATPFAWGKCGLILPRYPGTRVVMVHRNGQPSDPVDVGAVWESGTASANAQTGDWWLALPTEATHPDSLDDSATPDNYSGKASNDLTDAGGNRFIEVAGLTIRVGDSALKPAGDRPDPAQASESLTIEHGDGLSRIVLKKGGEIEIHAKKITLSTDGVTATLDASTLDVS
jgi:hypothetical protein